MQWLALGVAALSLSSVPRTALAQGNCTTVDVGFQPAVQDGNPFAPQIVAWIERPDGEFQATIFITQQTGTYGIGNRPGRFDFNSGPAWPYGRRLTVFPVWAHRHGMTWPEVVFQNADDSNLSHPFNQSSPEVHFCRPLMPSEPAWDAMTCASPAFTDKGMFGEAASLYPPRDDLDLSTRDHPDVEMFAMLNPFDAVSQPTPQPGALATVTWPVPPGTPAGDYVLFVEVSREFDMNATYNPISFPPPAGIPWSEYGEPYRGQPSVVYRIPFTLSDTDETTAATSAYAGYGDPDGLDGELRAPDDTITIDVPGSGAGRLQLVADGGAPFRVRVRAKPQFDAVAPAVPRSLALVSTSSTQAAIGFVAPGDDGGTGVAKQYEIRYVAGTELTAEDFAEASLVPTVAPIEGGTVQTFTITGLLPETDYTVGIRAVDDCNNQGELAVLTFTTEERQPGEVDACFVATAAYGSALAKDVDLLRRFRDALLRRTVLGELAVETYYTFSPPLAGVVGESDLLRATARDLLAPIVGRVRELGVAR